MEMEKENAQGIPDIVSDMEQKEKVIQTYYEVKIGKTLYRVTSVYLGRMDLQKAIEDYTVQKILAKINDSSIEQEKL